jgi:hypothetical protein
MHGAIPNSLADKGTNAQAFRTALTLGFNRIRIPEGIWFIEEIMFNGNTWLPANLEIFGDGREKSILIYRPTDNTIPAFDFTPDFVGQPVSRTILRDLQVIGPVEPSIGVQAEGIGVRMFRSQLNIVREVEIWKFAIGIDLGKEPVPMDPVNFTGYTAIENFEINACTTGIRLRDASNGVLLKSGRILAAFGLIGSLEDPADPESPPTLLPIQKEIGVGIHIEGTNSASGPGGGSGVVISQVTVENSPLCLKIVNSHDIVVEGCYFEPGHATDGNGETLPNDIPHARRIYEVDTVSERIDILGTVISPSNLFDPIDPVASEHWTPIYNRQLPEARGIIDPDAFQASGLSQTNKVHGAGTNGATAAHANHIRNGDFSRGLMFWAVNSTTTGFATEQIGATDSVVGGSSVRLVSSAQKTDHIAQDFVVDAGVRSITAMVRYRIDTPDPAAFRVEIATVNGAIVTPIGFYSDTDASDLSLWRVRAVTARFEGTLGGIKGPRTFQIRLYPYNVDGAASPLRRVIVDSVWVVEGEYAAPYRPYQEGVEVLVGGNRSFLFQGANANAPAGPAGIPASVPVPSNAVGMVTEMMIRSTSASTVLTTLRVDDNTALGFDEVRDVVAFVNNRPTITEYTVPLLGSGTGPTWSMLGATGGNLVTYSVRLKAWIYRM